MRRSNSSLTSLNRSRLPLKAIVLCLLSGLAVGCHSEPKETVVKQSQAPQE